MTARLGPVWESEFFSYRWFRVAGVREMASQIRSHRDLIVWQQAMELAMEVYRLSKLLPEDERYRLVDQLCRSAASVPASIAEGHARDDKHEYALFLAMARGSLMEVSTFLELATRLELLTAEQSQSAYSLIDDCDRTIGLIRESVVESES